MRWRPLVGPPHARHVDAVEQHRELRGVDAQRLVIVLDYGHAETPGFESLVKDDEAAVVPGQDFHPVATARDENEERAAIDVFLPLALHESHQPVDAAAQVDGL